MLYFSSLLKTSPQYSASAQNLFAALEANQIKYDVLPGTKDIWLRDFMPVQKKEGNFISFRYEPRYLKNQSQLRTDFRRDIKGQFSVFDDLDIDDSYLDDSDPYTAIYYSDINLDGGNVVLSPSKEKAIISDRVFSENPGYDQTVLVRELERLIEAHVVIIPSLPFGMTGHADGLVRFVDNNTVAGNMMGYKNGLEQRIQEVLAIHGISMIAFPWFPSIGGSVAGCYLNFLETYDHIFFPVFGNEMDNTAIEAAQRIFSKTIIPVRVEKIAAAGGSLNRISWEIEHRNTEEYQELHFPIVICPVCGSETLGMYWICDRCGWEWDGTVEEGEFSDANNMTLAEYKQQWRQRFASL